ncbi:MAG: esterase family protein [Clostridia bacterium]|nr:esterase family protein [Clostridia bacterium]
MFLEMILRSKKLNKSTQVNVLIPDEAIGTNQPYRTLWLFHGRSDDHTAWMRYTSIERYAKEHGLAVVMPDVDRSWYTNTAYGMNYFDFVAEELPKACRGIFKGMSEKREDNIVAGLSMGGYGALKLALSCPDQYSACISLSGALDVTRKGRPCDLDEWRSIFGYEIESPLELQGSKHDLFALAARNKSEGKPFPKLYLWCGEEDSLININRSFDQHLSELGIPHAFETSEGNHSWKWWDLHIQSGISYILDKE